MRTAILAALIIGVWIVPSQGQPKKRIVQNDSSGDAGKPREANRTDKSQADETIKAILAQGLQIQQQNAQILKNAADQSQQEITVDGKLVKYTRALVWVGLLQAVVLFFTVFFICRQTQLMNREFIAIHRPKLRIRRVTLKKDMPITHPGIEITNVGDTRAAIIGSHFQIVPCGSEADAVREFNDETPNNPVPRCELKGGESTSGIALPYDEALKRVQLLIEGGTRKQYVIGWVRYRDENKIIRRTGFFRERDPLTGLFSPGRDANPDYEYED